MAIIERTNVVPEAKAQVGAIVFQKAGALIANDFAGLCIVGSLAVDTATPKLYQCTATNGTSTSTWAVVGLQT